MSNLQFKIQIGFLGLLFGILFSFSLIVSSIDPFTGTREFTNLLTYILIFAVLVPILLFLLFGKKLLDKSQRILTVSVVISIFMIAINSFLQWDIMTWNNWIGAPVVMQLGLYWAYNAEIFYFYVTSWCIVDLLMYVSSRLSV
jgi:amino acid permease